MMQVLLVTLGLMAGLTAPAAATAQASEQDWARCRGDSPDSVIAGCTAVLGTSGLSESERSEALSIRAFAYRFRRDYPHAIADYREALRLNPRAIWAHSGLWQGLRRVRRCSASDRRI
jgi:tetratricopeptide (TPR) repeat protein